jgi:hypothetical protein
MIENMIENKIKILSSPVSLASLLLAIALFVPASGQTRERAREQEKKEQQQSSATAKKTSAVNESCDGALNIVPTRSMSFARKRRPAQSEAKPETKTETKKEDAKSETKTKKTGR